MGFELADDSKTSSKNPESEHSAFPSMLRPGEGASASLMIDNNQRVQPLEGTGAASAFCAGVALQIWQANPHMGPAEIVSELKKGNSPCVTGEKNDSFGDASKLDGPVDSTNGEPKLCSLKDYREMIEQEERKLGYETFSPWKKVQRREESQFSFGFPKTNREIVPMKKVPYIPKD